MPAGRPLHVDFAAGLLHIMQEIAGVQPMMGDDDLLEDIEEYAEFDGSELPLIDNPDLMYAVDDQGAHISYIDVEVQGTTLRVAVIPIKGRGQGPDRSTS